MRAERVSTGIPALDGMLGGGLERGTITQIFGEPGCGKSTFVLITVISVLREGEGVVFFDTEGLSIERFGQIAGGGAETLASRMYIYEPSTFEAQGMMIAESEQLLKKGGIGLYVMDTATALYRTELGGLREAQRRLAAQLLQMLGMSRRYQVPILITNQVYLDPESGEYRPLGGTAMQHISKAIIRIERLNGGKRRAVLVKHRARPEGISFDFEMTSEGVRVL
ncbi:MAG: DNA repair and recombination protein RadB [Methanomicrobiales archaeon]|nr:DNA repair and recombination protein RadB [Methanomicrobiales archaeon]